LIYLIDLTLYPAIPLGWQDLQPPLAVDFIIHPFEIRQFMTISEKIDNSANHTRFTLYKEGLLYKFYNEDAMVFVKNIREYKVSKNFVKSVGEDVYSIGFPVSEIKKGSLSVANILEKIGANGFEVSEGNIVYLLNDMVTKNDYEAWKKTIQERYVGIVKQPSTQYQRSNLCRSNNINDKKF
jgi:hypothetical protein